MTNKWFEIKDLHVNVGDKEILKGLTLTINEGEIHAIMGPNGSGKSTTAYTIAGHPNYQVTGGDILFKGQSILELAADERSRSSPRCAPRPDICRIHFPRVARPAV